MPLDNILAIDPDLISLDTTRFQSHEIYIYTANETKVSTHSLRVIGYLVYFKIEKSQDKIEFNLQVYMPRVYTVGGACDYAGIISIPTIPDMSFDFFGKTYNQKSLQTFSQWKTNTSKCDITSYSATYNGNPLPIPDVISFTESSLTFTVLSEQILALLTIDSYDITVQVQLSNGLLFQTNFKFVVSSSLSAQKTQDAKESQLAQQEAQNIFQATDDMFKINNKIIKRDKIQSNLNAFITKIDMIGKVTIEFPKTINPQKDFNILAKTKAIRSFLKGYFNFALASMIGLNFSNNDIMNQVTASLTATFIFGMPILCYLFLTRNLQKLPKQDFMIKFGSLYLNLKLDDKKAALFTFVFLIRRMILALSKVFLQSLPYVQLFLQIFSSFGMLSYLICFQPQDSNKMLYFEISNEFKILSLSYMLIPFAFNSIDYQNIKFSITALTGLNIPTNWMNLVVSMLATIFIFIKGKIAKYRLNKQSTPTQVNLVLTNVLANTNNDMSRDKMSIRNNRRLNIEKAVIQFERQDNEKAMKDDSLATQSNIIKTEERQKILQIRKHIFYQQLQKKFKDARKSNDEQIQWRIYRGHNKQKEQHVLI